MQRKLLSVAKAHKFACAGCEIEKGGAKTLFGHPLKTSAYLPDRNHQFLQELGKLV